MGRLKINKVKQKMGNRKTSQQRNELTNDKFLTYSCLKEIKILNTIDSY